MFCRVAEMCAYVVSCVSFVSTMICGGVERTREIGQFGKKGCTNAQLYDDNSKSHNNAIDLDPQILLSWILH